MCSLSYRLCDVIKHLIDNCITINRRPRIFIISQEIPLTSPQIVGRSLWRHESTSLWFITKRISMFLEVEIHYIIDSIIVCAYRLLVTNILRMFGLLITLCHHNQALSESSHDWTHYLKLCIIIILAQSILREIVYLLQERCDVHLFTSPKMFLQVLPHYSCELVIENTMIQQPPRSKKYS